MVSFEMSRMGEKRRLHVAFVFLTRIMLMLGFYVQRLLS